MFRAVHKAGFNEENFQKLKNVFMITEPEAAARPDVPGPGIRVRDLRLPTGSEGRTVEHSQPAGAGHGRAVDVLLDR